VVNVPKRSDRPEAASSTVDAFIQAANRTPAQHASGGRPRLIFALDATMSRQPTWRLATELQSRMFEVAEGLGGLDVQLVYFRGFSECRASPFVSGGAGLTAYMRKITVRGGRTQIVRVLGHAVDEARLARVGALVFIGDAVEEAVDALCARAGELALLGTKAFLFQEGRDRTVAAAFAEIARLTGGAHASFDAAAPDVLASLLAAAAAYAAGGLAAVQALASRSREPETRRLLAQIR
jgi:hypothetical protein